jgi:hypothetical protein
MKTAAASQAKAVRPWDGWGFVALVVVAAASLGLYVYLGQRLFLLNPVWVYLSAYLVLFCYYAYAAGRIAPRLDPKWHRAAVVLVVVSAILFRLALVSSPPSLSTDIYRYIWDGRLSVHGINPYRWTPDAASLYYLHDSIWEKMDYKTYQTIYMPVSQAVFALCALIFRSNVTGFKLVYTLFDIGIIGLLLAILRQMGRPAIHVIWYAWCPLPITEISIAGHQDVVGVFFLLLTFLLAIRKGNQAWTGVALVAAGLTKGFALLLIPMFARRYGKPLLMGAIPALVYLSLPIVVYLPSFLKGMDAYLVTVHVNASLFRWTDMALGHVTRQHFQITSRLSDLAILTAAIWAAWKRVVDDTDLLRRAFIVTTVTLLVVPTLFPWYLLWVLPFFCLLGRRPSWSFVILVCAIAMLYTYYFQNHLYWWMVVVEYVPFYAILIWEYATYRMGENPLRYLARRRAHSLGAVSLPQPVTVPDEKPIMR